MTLGTKLLLIAAATCATTSIISLIAASFALTNQAHHITIAAVIAFMALTPATPLLIGAAWKNHRHIPIHPFPALFTTIGTYLLFSTAPDLITILTTQNTIQLEKSQDQFLAYLTPAIICILLATIASHLQTIAQNTKQFGRLD